MSILLQQGYMRALQIVIIIIIFILEIEESTFEPIWCKHRVEYRGGWQASCDMSMRCAPSESDGRLSQAGLAKSGVAAT